MSKRVKMIKSTELNKTQRARNRYTLLFFLIVFPFCLIFTGVIYVLDSNGFEVYQMLTPSLAMFLLSLLCLFLGYLVSYLLMNALYEPLERLNEASQKVAHGDYDVHLDYNGKIKELKTTIENFNFMMDELNSVEIMRQDFIANVSHEFKTPLSSISGYVTLLQDPELTEEERNEYVQMAFFNIEKLNDLTGNILELSKLENQNTIEEPVVYRLDEQLREAIVLLEPKWNPKQIQLELELPKINYSGQKALLFQVWTNLIGNAIKFTPTGGTVSIHLQKTSDKIRIQISDTGIGMSKETLSHIFEKFYQGDTSRKSQGNGLGLALSKKIVELSGGTIAVASIEHQGSCFTVTLPL